MIVFEKVRWKNFLSTGDEFTEVQLNRSPSTLIVGQNGAGKSTLLDALSFGLFGKPHRDIKKDQMINSINKKNSVVEVEFSIGVNSFKVMRSIRPGKFEIWQNGNMINQASNARDYQKFLEQNILKLNHKSFHQIIVLGSSSFIPFMQLSTGNRREVIEDLLDIQIFSKMNQILKERNSVLREKVNQVNNQLEIVREKIKVHNKYIGDLEALNDEHKVKINGNINKANKEIEELQAKNIEWSSFIEANEDKTTKESNKLHDKKQAILQYQHEFKRQIKELVSQTKFYEDNETCPTCTQDISEVLRSEKIATAKDRAKELQQGMDHANSESVAVEQSIDRITGLLTEIRQRQSDIHVNNTSIARLQGQIRDHQSELASLDEKRGDIAEAIDKLNALNSEKESLGESKLSYIEDRSYNEAMSELLKDTGIKTKIIKQYLPAMNKLINQYLQVLDFFVSFNLDESFNETIKSRHRDEFTYASFSEGEKQRIDLALLFTWRQIAKMKNSTNTNLLILDETFDSSLDNDGIENLTKILSTLSDDTNVFIISHKGDVLESKFRNKIEFIKEHNFSKMLTA
jgi:DNA repair exonuclease SbcCD ATPase subunit